MSPLLDKISMARSALDKHLIAEDMAFMVIEDLKEEGFDAELVKGHRKKIHTWKIVPKGELNGDELTRFQKLKDSLTDMYREREMERLKDFKRSLLK